MVHSFPRASFYIRIYEIVDDPSSDPIISWSKSNNGFIIWDIKEFCREILPKSVGFGRNYHQFILTLLRHGFERVKGTGQLEFGLDEFVRGQPDLLIKMMVKIRIEKMERLKAKKARAKARKARVKVEHLLHNLRI